MTLQSESDINRLTLTMKITKLVILKTSASW